MSANVKKLATDIVPSFEQKRTYRAFLIGLAGAAGVAGLTLILLALFFT